MKKITFSILLLAGLQTNAQTFFTYGTKSVTKDEFLRQFNRNLSPAEDKNKAMQEYLPLYINYKLKVQDAYDKKLDTEYTQIAELAEFRRQIEDNYFSQQANLDDLVKEATTRSQKDIHLQDIYIGFDGNDPKSITEASANADKAYQQLKGGASFEKVAEQFGTDADLKASNADLGWITVFSFPYRIESETYNLPLNGFSEPIRTRNAFHIFKKTAERKAVGKVKVAQILFPFPPQAAPEAKIALQKQADSVYRLLQGGADFGQMAAKVSYDKTSYQNGGQLAEFGIGSYEKTFEDQAFGLQKKGDLSKPFTTSYGVHILKLIDRVPVNTDAADANATATLRQQVAADNRMEQAKTNLVKSLLPKIGYVPNKMVNKQQLWQYTDSTLQGKTVAVKGLTDKTELFHYTRQAIAVGDWVRFAKAFHPAGTGTADYDALMDQFVNATAAEYYKSHLENYNADFKNQIQEFKDANLNFEVTQKAVWEKASADSVGLAKFYAANKSKYQWGPSVNAIIVTGTDKASAEEAHNQMVAHIGNWRAIVNSMETRLLADSNRFEQSQVPAPANATIQFQPKTFTPMVPNTQDSSMTFSYIIDVINQPGQRSFEEARGFVINDYQQLLENSWLEELKKKYPVKVNNTVWNTMVKK